ncbi:Protein serine/threonine phosphatase PrpC, regulation of stationary phase [hydrothermal vent metagenome]|uniref:Protein serine/threonine phosphatase PrpC, regulation of stationary phase n=1 Tax=hydrothermal vent metagenome TaxID=652676 RepID=A0A3B0YUT6_9ZZZZ
MKYQLGSVTRIGNRKENQDSYDSFSNDEALVMVIADGLGGHKGGLLASKAVIRSVASAFKKEHGLIDNPAGFLQKVVLDSHDEINQVGARSRPPIQPRTTAVICLIQAGLAWWVHVGDSRLYLFRQGESFFRTRDHSRMEELMQDGSLTTQQALTHPERHRITRCLGGPEAIKSISISKAVPLQMGDIILLCTDGLWGAMRNQRILELVNGYHVDDMVNHLASEAETLSMPHTDNITIMLMRWLSTSQKPTAILKNQTRKNRKNPTPARNSPKLKGEVSDAVGTLKAIFDEYEKELK